MTRDRRFCPNCGSDNVEPDTSHTNVLGDMMFNQNKWRCKECDYTGIMPEGEAEEETEFEQTEQKTVDSSAGKAYFKYIIYVLIPLSIVYIAYLLFL